jgi:hypothetical protein
MIFFGIGRGYFVDMISSGRLRQIAAASSNFHPIWVDVDGEEMSLDSESEPSVPVLVVSSVTEAVKRLEGSKVAEHVDRDTLWQVEGFVLDRSIIDRLPDDIESADQLIDAVTRLGLEWSLLHQT